MSFFAEFFMFQAVVFGLGFFAEHAAAKKAGLRWLAVAVAGLVAACLAETQWGL